MASSDKEKAIKMKIAYNSRQYDLALQTLAEAVEEQHINQYVKDAVIKRFEYTYENGVEAFKGYSSVQRGKLDISQRDFPRSFQGRVDQDP